MTPEQQAALERLRLASSGRKYEAYWIDTSSTEFVAAIADRDCRTGMYHDQHAITEFVLSEYPADDQEPVTEAWLRTIKHASYNGSHWTNENDKCSEWLIASPRSNFLRIVFSKDQLYVSFCDTNGRTHQEVSCDGGYRTRGDVRRLCKALGIDLQPTSKEQT